MEGIEKYPQLVKLLLQEENFFILLQMMDRKDGDVEIYMVLLIWQLDQEILNLQKAYQESKRLR